MKGTLQIPRETHQTLWSVRSAQVKFGLGIKIRFKVFKTRPKFVLRIDWGEKGKTGGEIHGSGVYRKIPLVEVGCWNRKGTQTLIYREDTFPYEASVHAVMQARMSEAGCHVAQLRNVKQDSLGFVFGECRAALPVDFVFFS